MKRFKELRLKNVELPMGVVLKKPTNADRIRAMSDEELYVLFREIYNAGVVYGVSYMYGKLPNNFAWTMKWLKQPVEVTK